MTAWHRIEIVEADITELEVDAIVNAANTSLLGGCATGDAKLTKGYNLPAKFVIHTVGPKWNDGRLGERAKLASCYRRSLEIARANAIQTIAFPGISTGIYGYPQREAADTALATVHEALVAHELPRTVIMCTYDSLATMIMTEAYDALAKA